MNQLKQSEKFLDFRDTNSINYQHILETHVQAMPAGLKCPLWQKYMTNNPPLVRMKKKQHNFSLEPVNL